MCTQFWFDGKGNAKNAAGRFPAGLNESEHFEKVLRLIRSVSPPTLVTGYREWGGDLASSYRTLNLYDSGPVPTLVASARPTAAVAMPWMAGDRD